MAHTFPPRKHRAKEVADPDVLNEAFQDIAAKLAGHINEHDISSDKSGLAPAANAYYAGHQTVKDSSPNWFNAAGFYASINGEAGHDATATIADATGWQSIQDDGGSDVMSTTMTCGDGDILCVFAQLQYCAWSGTDTTVPASIDAPIKMQYAIRVDGSVIDESITGAAIYPDPPPQEWYRASPTSGDEFDYRHQQYIQNTIGLSPAVCPARLLYCVPVTSGSHVAEVVARRLPMSDYKIDTATVGTTVQVFNRRIFTLRLKGMSPHTGNAPSVSIDALEDGEVLAATDITTNGFTVLQTAINALGDGYLERGALRNEHLPSVVYGAKVKFITPGSPTGAITGLYPGYGTNSAGWTVVTDAGDNVEVTGPTAGEWRLDTYPGVLIVLANVQVAYVKGTTDPGQIGMIGCFAIRITNSAGTVSVIGGSEVYVNSHNFNNEATNAPVNIEMDVPLMWAVDSTTLSAANRRIAKIELVASTWNGYAGTSPSAVEMKTQQACITALALKGVTIA